MIRKADSIDEALSRQDEGCPPVLEAFDDTLGVLGVDFETTKIIVATRLGLDRNATKEEIIREIIESRITSGIQTPPATESPTPSVLLLLMMASSAVKYNTILHEFGPLVDVSRLPNPSYSEQDFEAEVEENKQRNIRQLQENLSTEENTEWRRIWEKALATFDDEWIQWSFIHEFTRLMPAGIDRGEGGSMDAKLQQDLDDIIRKHYDYDRYVYLENRKNELTLLERRGGLSEDESGDRKDELSQIERELGKYDLKLLYIEMRRLGYTQKDLRTKGGPDKYS